MVNRERVGACLAALALLLLLLPLGHATPHANQLYEDLMYNYNKNVRPVKNVSQPVVVQFGASLIRIIDVVSGKPKLSLSFHAISKAI